MHELKMHRESAFLTLTYSDANLPPGYTLRKRDLQLFMKRLRLARPQGLRFFACGEYGDQTLRPHYHVLLLNSSFSDLKWWSGSDDRKLYVSAELKRLWTNGDSLIGQVSFESCAYVARYVMKKRTGVGALEHYRGREPEFTVMSRRPGLGSSYYDKFGAEVFRHDSVIVNAREVGAPRYYDKKLELSDPSRLLELKRLRRASIRVHRADQTPDRRRVREAVELSKQRTFSKRPI